MRNLLRLIGQVCSGLRFRLLLLVALACAPLVAWTFNTAWEDRRHAMSNWRQRAQKIVELATQEEQRMIGDTRQFLLAMADADVVRARNPRDCKQLIEELHRSSPRYANLGVIGTN